MTPSADQIDPSQLAARFAEDWAAALAESLAAMAGKSCRAAEQAAARPENLEGELLRFEQPFEPAYAGKAWVIAPKASWLTLGGLALEGAGIEPSEPEARTTYLELVGQSMAGLAARISAIARTEVRSEGGHEVDSLPELAFRSVVLRCGEAELPPLYFAFTTTLSGPPQGVPEVLLAKGDAPAESPGPNGNLGLLLDIELPVAISFGRAELVLKEVLKLSTGSIVELNRAATAPVEVVVNNRVVARGEVVVVDGNYGVRIQEIISARERMEVLG